MVDLSLSEVDSSFQHQADSNASLNAQKALITLRNQNQRKKTTDDGSNQFRRQR